MIIAGFCNNEVILKSLKRKKNVKYLGYLSDDDLYNISSKVDAFVNQDYQILNLMNITFLLRFYIICSLKKL